MKYFNLLEKILIKIITFFLSCNQLLLHENYTILERKRALHSIYPDGVVLHFNKDKKKDLSSRGRLASSSGRRLYIASTNVSLYMLFIYKYIHVRYKHFSHNMLCVYVLHTFASRSSESADHAPVHLTLHYIVSYGI